MHESADPSLSLEHRTVTAHWAYLDALVFLERVRHRAECATCAAAARDETRGGETIDGAERLKEACRLRFRDLLGELGYLPSGLSSTLPASDEAVCALGSGLD